VAVANKFRSSEDLAAIRNFAQKHRLEIVGEIPYDEEIQRADLAAEPPRLDRDHAAVAAVRKMLERLKV
jgi:CO dehydrogenase nickel-insertion accessory protein CooC1